LINPDRLCSLNSNSVQNGKYVLYWMQASQRSDFNHALEYAIEQANEHNQPLLTVFCLLDNYPYANVSHYRFMLQGLFEVSKSLNKRGIGFAVYQKDPQQMIPALAEDASMIIVDRDYQRNQIEWRRMVASSINCPLVQVETNVIIPVETVSKKEEYSAGTIRPKIHRILSDYLAPLRNRRVKRKFDNIGFGDTDLSNINRVVNGLHLKNRDLQEIPFRGGASSGRQLLRKFILNDLEAFAFQRNDPASDHLSNMSPFLHFGQLSPLEIALEVLKTESSSVESYLEELIIRRELSMNFAFYNANYDNIECLPRWAKETLDLHASDPRDYTYTIRELEQSRTHDHYWNAAQREMTRTGKMHGYMRMYWGKKIIEWSDSPEEAYRICIELNDKYELDGRDPNGYAGVAWCFGKHDRAWKEREIFGKVRYMNANGLRRKFDIKSYVQRIGD
jgi:deoxyribodipyrimidine photo-lyase